MATKSPQHDKVTQDDKCDQAQAAPSTAPAFTQLSEWFSLEENSRTIKFIYLWKGSNETKQGINTATAGKTQLSP